MDNGPLKINYFTIYSGRNIFSHRPVVKIVVDIGPYGKIPTNQIDGFNEKLLALLPGLRKNRCGLGYEGGFVQRLEEGTYLAHVLEHVALELQFAAGYDISFGKTRLIKEPSVYYLVYEFENEACGLECGKTAVYLLNRLLAGKTVDIGGVIGYLKQLAAEGELGPSTAAIVAEAKKRGIPVTRIGSESLVRLGYGRHSRLIEATLTDSTSCLSADISCNKQLTKCLLSENRIPVPYGKVVYSELSAVMAADEVGRPVVVKPFDSNQGKGVHLNLKNDGQIKTAFREASQFSRGVIVEKYVCGGDFRILVVGGAVCAVSERLPAGITGDGTHSVRELVESVNKNPDRGEEHEKPLTKIKLDAVTLAILKKSGRTFDTIPAAGERVVLRENANLSTGGTAIDRTDDIHPENARIAIRAANAIGLDIAGIDIVTKDISRPLSETGGAVVEVNTAPGIRMHLYPSKGNPRNVAADIVRMLFPDEKAVRFPIVSVTGTNGKTTVVRMISHTLTLSGFNVGSTSTSGTYVNGRLVCPGDNSGPTSARTLLADKRIDAAVLETARGGILRAGLGYDLADVGVITNITGDHLGLDGVETLEDLAFVKSLVAEAVKKTGCAVLNADDRMTSRIARRVKAGLILFHRSRGLPESLAGRCRAEIYVRNGFITAEEMGAVHKIAAVNNIPATCGGRILCNVENALAATAALTALNIPPRLIARGLTTFTDNEGRFSLYALGGVRVMLDYGHNPEGYRNALAACRNLAPKRLLGVIGMPGDRSDSAMADVGRQCAAACDQLFVKEDGDLRGRESGETAGIFYDSIIRSGFEKNRVKIILNELDALKDALDTAEEGDLIAVFYEKLQPLIDFLSAKGAVKINPAAKKPAKNTGVFDRAFSPALFPAGAIGVYSGACRMFNSRSIFTLERPEG